MNQNKDNSVFGEIIHDSAPLEQKPGVGSIDLCCTACCTCSAASVSGGVDTDE